MPTITKIEGLVQDSNTIEITLSDGKVIKQYHRQDCCEYVAVHQVDGNISKHIGAKYIELLCKSRRAQNDEVSASGTWTFYTLKTSKGYLDWRWLGESNGYYSEDVTTVTLYPLELARDNSIELVDITAYNFDKEDYTSKSLFKWKLLGNI